MPKDPKGKPALMQVTVLAWHYLLKTSPAYSVSPMMTGAALCCAVLRCAGLAWPGLLIVLDLP